jgi:NADP-reducing hydrogenase subunit HndB
MTGDGFMTAIKSLEDLQRVRFEALEKRKAITTSKKVRILVAMGSCGIAAGANETMKAITDQIEAEKLSGILVTQTGCIGLCSSEPIVQVVSGEDHKTIYGKVSPSVARRIIKEHVANEHIVQEYVVKG